ncbi:uncharacterized protein LOC133805963 [Humulus lupulus]|uniref:uncharacterized protein LOC133805963 n=1 Tax=Humulus lupulus TaxID=3486 RepID=UPI002B40E383|nr:uncharacterized protein LOC133805963 [Humulus lupulus]
MSNCSTPSRYTSSCSTIQAQLDALTQMTGLEGVKDDVRCRIFPATLAYSAQQWFFKLEPGAINSWNALVRLLYSQLFAARILPAELNDLDDIKKGTNKALENYVQHFMQEPARSKIVNDDGKSMAIMARIQVKGPLCTDLRRKIVYSTREFRDRAEEFIKLE